MFLSDEVFVEGFPWCATEPKRIGLSGLTKKILCEKHNSELSEADNEGIRTFEALREATRLSNVRSSLKPRIWTIKKFRVDGAQLERWFLKTLINVAYEGVFPIGRESTEPGQPPSGLVEIAFGIRRFEPQAGLYAMGQVGEQIQAEDRVRVVTLIDARNHLMSALFHFRGFRFLLCIDTDGPGQGPLGVRTEDGRILEVATRPLYHPKKLRWLVHKHVSHVIDIRW